MAATDLQPVLRPTASVEVSGSRRRRRGPFLALTAALIIIVAPVTAWLISEPASSGVSGITHTATTGPTPSSAKASRAPDPSSPYTSAPETIELKDSSGFAKPFQTVQIKGTYRGGADTFLRIQRWEEGRWVAFPVPAKTDQSGEFTAYAELGRPGRYQLRLLDPDSGVKSEPFALAIKS